MKHLLILLTVFTLSISAAHARGGELSKETVEMLELFGDVFEKAKEEYVEEKTDKELVEGAINGMLTDLDPHSAYLNEEDFKEMQVQTKGEFGGLGIEVTLKNGLVYVVAPIDDTPAANAGVLAGDYISHIDGESVFGMTLSEAVKKMRGKPRTKIDIVILRDGADEPIDMTIIRDKISIKNVRYEVHDDIGYIRITSFSGSTGKNVKDAITALEKEIGKDTIKGYVLDLRNNPGGLLDQAIEVSDIFLDRGEIVSTRGREAESTERSNATKGDETNGLPLVTLINGGSASASEIVAGALQDHKRAITMGTKSFGKGSVQTIIPLQRNVAMRLTTALYYTPSGKSIQAEGIVPDILVEPAKLEFLKKGKQTSEADLPGHLQQAINKAIEESDADEEKKNDAKKDEDKPLYERDYQLARAIDFIKGIYLYNRFDEKRLQQK